ncbi:unnamed protein product [Arabidopsis lyrata]|nr:unnamed protein product [Arabidopsis lyrata]
MQYDPQPELLTDLTLPLEQSLVGTDNTAQISVIDIHLKKTEELTPEEPKMKHQEIDGPTVERDLSALGNETRQVLEGMMKNMYSLSGAMGALGLTQLIVGATILYATRSDPMKEMTIQSCIALVQTDSQTNLVQIQAQPKFPIGRN